MTLNAAQVATMIITPRVSQTVTAAAAATFSVVASGTAPLSYQWQKNSVNISGATASSYTERETIADGTGLGYKAEVSNSNGWATRIVARLIVNMGKV